MIKHIEYVWSTYAEEHEDPVEGFGGGPGYGQHSVQGASKSAFKSNWQKTNKCSDRSMELLLPALLGNNDRQTNQPNNHTYNIRTLGFIRMLYIQK